MKTKIEWATHTWNPVTGCTPISEGCEHCYAARMAKRLAGRCGYPKDDPFRPGITHSNPFDPLKIKKPSMIFVCSMGDLFHNFVTDDSIDSIFAVMATAKHHTFILLTKRPQRMLNYCTGGWQSRLIPYLRMLEKIPEGKGVSLHTRGMALPNVWLGVTAENQARADERIPILLQIPAAVRFVSVEPILGPVDLEKYFTASYTRYGEPSGLARETLDWVICGGETGPGARPMHPNWARSLRDQCEAAQVPFCFKSWGEYRKFIVNGCDRFTRNNFWMDSRGMACVPSDSPSEDCSCMKKVGKKLAGDLIDGVQYHQYPEVR